MYIYKVPKIPKRQPLHWRIQGGAPGTRAPPWGSKFFHFHVVLGKNVKNNSNFGSWRPPPGENPGSATALTGAWPPWIRY